ncbi:MAG TPA: tRNA pseudouridine(55) synthase TruB [Longimicrobiales bacterium]|nr:tRNA pseudouridine(55) synthase TruB [Longimicrobiales bacterium]
MSPRRPGPTSGLSGVLAVDKPAGPTSHDVVDAARRALGERRIGHTGTLDPFASGLLLLCVGPATRLAEYIAGLPKSYRATARLGESTATADPEGEVTRRSDAWRALSEPVVRRAFETHVGVRDQRPPAFSAKKVGGERLYEKARRGEEVRAEPVPVCIHRLTVEEVDLPDVTFSLTCSTGTYVRAVARDVGDDLGVGGHLRALRRTAIGPHRVDDALALADLEDPGSVAEAMLSPLAALAHLRRLELDDAALGEVAHGRPVAAPEAALIGPARSALPTLAEPFLGALGQAAHLPPGAAVTASLAGTADPGLLAPETPRGLGGDARPEPVALVRGEQLVAVALLVEGLARPKKVFRGG